MTRTRLVAALGAVLLPLGIGATAGTATAVDPPPDLASITYSGPPYARVGWFAHPIASVTLSGPGQGDTFVTVTSDSPAVTVVGGGVTVPSGMSTADVLVDVVSTGTVTLTAALGPTSLPLEPALRVGGVADVPNLSELTVTPSHVQPGEPATGTVVLDFLAPPGGTVVSLASDSPDVVVPPSVVVAQDQERATFEIDTSSVPAAATLTATLADVVRTAALEVSDTLAPGTTITKVTVKHHQRRAVVRFTSSEPGSAFRCRLDTGGTRACTSPRTYKHLSRGKHTVRVWAVDAAGNVDPSAARATFKVRRR